MTEGVEVVGRDPLTSRVIGCALEVHRAVGPGLMEAVYRNCMATELGLRRVRFDVEVPMPVEYKGWRLDCGYRVDLLVEDRLIVELKVVAEILPIHQAQLLTYMRIARVSTGLLINFNVRYLRDGVRRFKL